MLDHTPLTILQKVSFCIFPFVMNVCFLIFIIVSITTTLSPLDPRNSIPITDCFFIYILDCVFFYMYGKCMGTFTEIFYGVEDNLFLDIILIITYPVFFLFYLPFIMYSMMKRYHASPADVWEKVFGSGGMSLSNLRTDIDSGVSTIGRYIYIGIPFGIFALIYILIFIALTPLWYFVFSPLGMTMYSICLAVSFAFDEYRASTMNDRVDVTYNWGLFLNIYGIALLATISSACYIGLVGPDWHAILLIVVSGLYFGIFCGPAIYFLFCSDKPPFEFP